MWNWPYRPKFVTHGTLSQLMFASLQACILLNDVTRLCTILNFSLNVFSICINCFTLCIIYLCFRFVHHVFICAMFYQGSIVK